MTVHRFLTGIPTGDTLPAEADLPHGYPFFLTTNATLYVLDAPAVTFRAVLGAGLLS